MDIQPGFDPADDGYVGLPHMTMTVEYRRVITLRHSANFTCGGVTGHTQQCIRSICHKIIHENCSPDTRHYTRAID